MKENEWYQSRFITVFYLHGYNRISVVTGFLRNGRSLRVARLWNETQRLYIVVFYLRP